MCCWFLDLAKVIVYKEILMQKKKENPYASWINTPQQSDLVYTCNNLRLLKLHQIKLHLLQTFISLKHKALPLSIVHISLHLFRPHMMILARWSPARGGGAAVPENQTHPF